MHHSFRTLLDETLLAIAVWTSRVREWVDLMASVYGSLEKLWFIYYIVDIPVIRLSTIHGCDQTFSSLRRSSGPARRGVKIFNPRVKIFFASDGPVGGQISLPASRVDSLLNSYLFPLTGQLFLVSTCHIDECE